MKEREKKNTQVSQKNTYKGKIEQVGLGERKKVIVKERIEKRKKKKGRN